MTTLTPRQHEAAQLIASGKSQARAAKAVGVSPQTMNAWFKKPDFMEVVADIIRGVRESTDVALQAQRTLAVEALANLLKAPTPPAIRLQAARMVLDLTDRPLAPRTPTAEDRPYYGVLNLPSDHEFTKEELDSFLQ